MQFTIYFFLIPDSDDIVLDVIAASYGETLLLVHNFLLDISQMLL
jgi:hypothetical protein